MKPKLLVVDLNNQLYKAAHVNPNLSSEGRYTGGLYGVIGAIQKAIRVTGATRILIGTDTRPYVRSSVFPGYKELRKDTTDLDLKDKVMESIPLVYKLAEVVGWPVWKVPGFEYDDIVSFCVEKHRHRYSEIIAMSNDSDIHQLFKYSNFSVYKGKKGIYKHSDFKSEWGIDPNDVPLFLSLTGTHNEVPGIKGIGPVTAKQLLLNPSKMRSVSEQHSDLIERNMKLIKLPHADFPDDLKLPKVGVFNERTFLRFCSQYDINVTPYTVDSFNMIRSE